MRDRLERVVLPEEQAAAKRGFRVVEAAFRERTPQPRRRTHWRAATVLALLGAVVAASVSPPGRAFLTEVRESVLPGRLEQAQTAVTLPASGRLLVVQATGGAWVLERDGAKRRLGSYRDAVWSPYGRFIAATDSKRLITLDPSGVERWSLLRPGVRAPSWGGSRTDTRIAYLQQGQLRIVAGDGTGDRLFARGVQVGPVWRPGPGRPHTLAYALATTVRVVEVETGRVLWTRRKAEAPTRLLWSANGSRLAVITTTAVTIYGRGGRMIRDLRFATPARPGRERPLAGTFIGDDLALTLRRTVPPRISRVVIARGRGPLRQLFAGAGEIGELAASPDGRWLLADWHSADQWLFLRLPHVAQVEAVAGISEEFPTAADTPQLLLAGRWCCSGG